MMLHICDKKVFSCNLCPLSNGEGELFLTVFFIFLI